MLGIIMHIWLMFGVLFTRDVSILVAKRRMFIRWF